MNPEPPEPNYPDPIEELDENDCCRYCGEQIAHDDAGQWVDENGVLISVHLTEEHNWP